MAAKKKKIVVMTVAQQPDYCAELKKQDVCGKVLL